MRVHKPSARWELFTVEDIEDLDSSQLYLRRYRVLVTPWFGVFVHKIMLDDSDRHLHDHPWVFGTLVLSGGYDEEFAYTHREAQDFASIVSWNRRLTGVLPLRLRDLFPTIRQTNASILYDQDQPGFRYGDHLQTSDPVEDVDDVEDVEVFGHRQSWREGSWHVVTLGQCHSIRKLHTIPTWTLVVTGPTVKHKSWGFVTAEGWQHHKPYIAARRKGVDV